MKSLNFQQIEDCIIGNEIQVNFRVVQELPASKTAHQCTFVLHLPRKPAILTRKMGYQHALNQTSSLANAEYIYRTLQWTKSGTYMYIDKFKIYRDSHFVLLPLVHHSFFLKDI